MNLKYYILFPILVAIILASCSEGLFRERPYDKLSQDEIWESPLLLDEYVLPWYSNMNSGFSVYMPTHDLLKSLGRPYLPWFADQITISKADWFNTAYGDILQGNTRAITRKAVGEWTNYYANIKTINVLLENSQKISEGKQKQRVLGEAHFFRAYYHYLLWRRFGGVIVMQKTYDPLVDKKQFPRASYDEMVEFIVQEAQTAAKLLDAENSPTDAGRVTQGAALMLIAKTYLWASSSIFQSKEKEYLGFTSDKSKIILEKAAAAYEELMKLPYKLKPVEGASEREIALSYRKIFLTKNSEESILEVQVSNDGSMDKGNGHKLDEQSVSPFYGGTLAAYTPLQNHVDEYGMRSGKSYDPADPYVNRDYRFYANVLYDGCTFRGREMEIHSVYEGTTAVPGADIKPYGTDISAAVSITGYYMGKFVNESQSIDKNPDKGSSQNYIIWRYAEALLDYAEVKFRQGETDIALNKVNEIRRRAHMHELSMLTWDALVNERRVEMAFEETTYWDILRWGQAEKKFNGDAANTPWKIMRVGIVNGKKLYRISDFSPEQAKMRYFKTYQYYWPIPWDEVRYQQFDQNPEWVEVG